MQMMSRTTKTKLPHWIDRFAERSESDLPVVRWINQLASEQEVSSKRRDSSKKKEVVIPTDEKTLLTSAQVAHILQVSRRTLSRYCADRLLNFIRSRGKLLFRRSAVELFLAQRDIHVSKQGRLSRRRGSLPILVSASPAREPSK